MMKMALQQLVCGFALMTILFCKGGHSEQPACIRAPTYGRIVGGQDAPLESWPWHTFLEVGFTVCGGSLINNQWVLTAAHCIKYVDPNRIVIHLGRQNRTGPNPNEMTRTPESIICHPQFNFFNFDNDICLLKMSSPVNFTDYIQPVCLASANSTFYDGTPSWVTGFGYTEYDSGIRPEALQEVDVPVVGNNRCRCNYKDFNEVTENMICAGLGGQDACQGDSGGPLVTKKNFNWVQSGIVSFGENCGLPMRPGVYTRVSRYQTWISQTVTGMEPGFITFTSSGTDSDLNFTCETPTTTAAHIPTTSHTPTTIHAPTPANSPTTTHIPYTTHTSWQAFRVKKPETPELNHHSTTTRNSFTTHSPTTTFIPTTHTPFTNHISTRTSTSTASTIDKDDSIFSGGQNLIHFIHFMSLFALVLFFHVFVGSG